MKIEDARGVQHTIYPNRPQRSLRQSDLAYNTMSYNGVKKSVMKEKEPETYLMYIKTHEEDEEPITLSTAEDDTSSSLPKSDDRQLNQIIRSFRQVFRETLPDALPPERKNEHVIDTGEAKPININAYPMSHMQLKEQAKQVKDLLDKGLINESASPWGFPVLFVKKPVG